LQEFEHRLNQIQELTRRFDSQARSFQDLLAAEENAAIEQGNAEVVSQWEQQRPAQVKDLIMTMIEKEEITDVVRLLKRIDEIKKRKILAQFSTEVEEEKQALYDIQALLRDGFPKKDVINAVRQQGNLPESGPQG
jgi:rubrerythrin